LSILVKDDHWSLALSEKGGSVVLKTLMRSLVISIFLIFFVPQISQPCTPFFLNHNGHTVFGKNFDWHIERGLVFINKRGVSKPAAALNLFVQQ
jgi:hypothetical protein